MGYIDNFWNYSSSDWGTGKLLVVIGMDLLIVTLGLELRRGLVVAERVGEEGVAGLLLN